MVIYIFSLLKLTLAKDIRKHYEGASSEKKNGIITYCYSYDVEQDIIKFVIYFQ